MKQKIITYQFTLPNGKKMLIPHSNYHSALAIAASEAGITFQGTNDYKPALKTVSA